MNQKNRNIGLYIHLPFCQRKCSYCGFLSLVDQPETVIKSYLKHLLSEADMQQSKLVFGSKTGITRPMCIDTIYIGGGTPSLINGSDMKILLDGIRKSWNVSKTVEVTMESNPNSLTAENLMAYRMAGINRLSIGVQSFDDSILSNIGRIHDSKTAMNAVTMAKDVGFENINLDLMFGLPGQTLDQWAKSLETAVKQQPTHLSLYTLQIEEGTSLYRNYKLGKLPPVDLSVDRACYHFAIDYLRQHGYQQYEISNFAKPGYECRHNIKYWSMNDFLGIGLNASSYVEGKRWRNLSDMEQWTLKIKNGILPVDTPTVLADTKSDAMGIFLFTGLRKTAGISLEEFEKLFGLEFFEAYRNIIDQLNGYREAGYLDWTNSRNGRLWITEAGIDHSNDIMSEFV